LVAVTGHAHRFTKSGKADGHDSGRRDGQADDEEFRRNAHLAVRGERVRRARTRPNRFGMLC